MSRVATFACRRQVDSERKPARLNPHRCAPSGRSGSVGPVGLSEGARRFLLYTELPYD